MKQNDVNEKIYNVIYDVISGVLPEDLVEMTMEAWRTPIGTGPGYADED